MYPLIDQLFQTKCSNREFIKCRTPHTCKRHLHDFQVFLHAKVLTSRMKRFHMWWMYFWPVKNHQQEFHMSFLSSENHLTPCLDVAVTDDRCKSATHLSYGILPFNEVEPEWALKCCYVKSHPADPHRRQHQREQHGWREGGTRGLKSGEKDATHLQMTSRLTVMLSFSLPASLHFFLSLSLLSFTHSLHLFVLISTSLSFYLNLSFSSFFSVWLFNAHTHTHII